MALATFLLEVQGTTRCCVPDDRIIPNIPTLVNNLIFREPKSLKSKLKNKIKKIRLEKRSQAWYDVFVKGGEVCV